MIWLCLIKYEHKSEKKKNFYDYKRRIITSKMPIIFEIEKTSQISKIYCQPKCEKKPTLMESTAVGLIITFCYNFVF